MSALPKQENDSVLAELPQPKGPGARLKAARQSKNIELDKAAAQLHLRRDMLIALEEDDYEHLPARVFIVGYMKNYARYVGLPAEAIVQSLDNFLPPVDKQKSELPKIGNETRDVFKPASSARKSPFSFFSLVLLIAAIAAFFAWSEGYFDSGTSETSRALSPVGALPLNISETQPSDSAANDQMQIDIPVSDDSGFQSPEIPLSAEIEQAVADETAELETTELIAPQETVSEQVPSETSTDNTGVNDAEQASAASDKPLQPVLNETAVAGDSSEVILKLAGKSWVEIRDASGEYKVNYLFKAGTEKTFSGTPPYKILIGNAADASIYVDGKPFDFKSYTSGNVARFTLDPAAL